MFCANCGSRFEANAKFCVNCGVENKSGLTLKPQAPPQPPMVEPQPELLKPDSSMPEKEVKIWKSVVAIIAIPTLLIGGLLFGLFWLIVTWHSNSVVDNYDTDIHAFEEFVLETADSAEVPRNHQLYHIPPTPEIKLAFIEKFAILAHEMDSDEGYFTTSERVIELFGPEYSEEETALGFNRIFIDVGFDLRVSAIGEGEEIFNISLFVFSDFLFDDGVDIKSEVLREYEETWWDIREEDRPNLHYFEELIGAGTIILYNYGEFMYKWESEHYEVRIVADRNGIVRVVNIIESF